MACAKGRRARTMAVLMLRLALALVMISVTVGCDEAAPTAPSTADLMNRVWQLQSVQRPDGTTVAVASPDRFTLAFGDTARLSIRADCNTCGGTYQVSGTELIVGTLACTRAFCGDNSLDTEFLRVFESASSLSHIDDALLVTRAGTRLTFRP